MTVTKEMVEAVSTYTVDVNGDFNEIKYELYKGWAEDELKIDDPGLSADKYDEAWANLICDIYNSSLGLRDIKSEKIGGYSYTKGKEDKSSYRIRYEELTKPRAIAVPIEGATREDAVLPAGFLFDKQPVPKFGGI